MKKARKSASRQGLKLALATVSIVAAIGEAWGFGMPDKEGQDAELLGERNVLIEAAKDGAQANIYFGLHNDVKAVIGYSNTQVYTNLGVTGAATLSSTLGVTGATTLSNTLGVSGAATLASTLDARGAISNSIGVVTFNDAIKTTNAGANLVINEVAGVASLTSAATGQGLTVTGTDQTVLKGGTNSGVLTLQDGDTSAAGATPAGTSMTISGSGGGTAATVLQTTTDANTTTVSTSVGTNAVYANGSTAKLQAGPANAVTVNSGNTGADPAVRINGVIDPAGSLSRTGVLITGSGQGNAPPYDYSSGVAPTWADVAIQSKSYGLGDPRLGSAILVTDYGVQIVSPQPAVGEKVVNNSGNNNSSGLIVNNSGLNSSNGSVENNTGGNSGSGSSANNIGLNTSTTGGTTANNVGSLTGNGTATNAFGNNSSTTGGVVGNTFGINSGNGQTTNEVGNNSGSGTANNSFGINSGTGTATNAFGNNTNSGSVVNTSGGNSGSGSATNNIGVNTSTTGGSTSNNIGGLTGNGTATNNFGVNSGTGSATNNFGNSTNSGGATNTFGQVASSGNVSNGFGNALPGSTGNATNVIGQNNGTGVMNNSLGGGTGASTNNIGVGSGLATNNIGTGPGVSINTIGNSTLSSTVTTQAGNSRSVMANGSMTTSVDAGGGLGTSVLSAPTQLTSGLSAVVLKDATAPHVVVDSNGRLSTSNGVAGQTSASVTVTNGYGNVHGLYVNERQTTLSGGTSSTSLTLDDNGATFSNAATGRPVRVHGVYDGRDDFDAVNVRQLGAGVAMASAMAAMPQVDASKRFNLTAGAGSYLNAGALAIGGSLRVRPSTLVRFGAAFSNNRQRMVNVGFGHSF